MKPFADYLKTNDVRKSTPDKGLAGALIKDAEERVEIILQIPLTEKSATLIFEQIYEALREHIDAILTLEGYKSYSHIASIAFLATCPAFNMTEIHTIDNAREKRNLAKYYAKRLDPIETQELIIFYNTIKPKLVAQFNLLHKNPN